MVSMENDLQGEHDGEEAKIRVSGRCSEQVETHRENKGKEARDLESHCSFQ